MAELAMLNFESFVNSNQGLQAYIQEADFNQEELSALYLFENPDFTIDLGITKIEQQNWNAEWEKNFTPIEVDEIVSIRAPFHENPNLKYDIVIEPKMSFGTGHHETTHMMVQHLLQLDLNNKQTLDMGCGTGILAIFAEMKGAKPIDAIDIDNWCYENSIENVTRNNCHHISVFEGDSSLLINKKYDLIIANINRNILLMDMKVYANCLKEKGILLLSGFYEEDIPIIDAEVSKYNLKLEKFIQRNNWVALKYNKL